VTGGILRYIDGANRVRSEAFDKRLMALPEHINDFIEVQRPIDTLSFLELRAVVQKLRESGHQVRKYVVQLTRGSRSRSCT